MFFSIKRLNTHFLMRKKSIRPQSVLFYNGMLLLGHRVYGSGPALRADGGLGCTVFLDTRWEGSRFLGA